MLPRGARSSWEAPRGSIGTSRRGWRRSRRPSRRRGRREELIAADRRVVDEPVDRSERVFDLRHDDAGAGPVAKVEAPGPGAAAAFGFERCAPRPRRHDSVNATGRPSATSARTRARPIPRLPPVTRTTPRSRRRLEPRARHGPGDAQRVDDRTVVARRAAVGLVEPHRHADDAEASPHGPDEDRAFGLESRLGKSDRLDQAAACRGGSRSGSREAWPRRRARSATTRSRSKRASRGPSPPYRCARVPSTRSAPSRQGARSLGISSGGCWPSASSVTTASYPLAKRWSNAAFSARPSRD